jgi:hypothetical protein
VERYSFIYLVVERASGTQATAWKHSIQLSLEFLHMGLLLARISWQKHFKQCWKLVHPVELVSLRTRLVHLCKIVWYQPVQSDTAEAELRMNMLVLTCRSAAAA